MGFYNNEELPFVKKCEGIVLEAKYSNKITLFRFLNQREIEILNQLKDDTFLYIDSCGDEYKRVIISPFEINPEFKTVLLKLNYNKKYLEPNHRMILGALMSLGIERNTIGDIYITTGNDVYFYATKEIEPYLISELRVIAHQAVELEEKKEIEGQIKKNTKTKTAFVASLRLDLITAQIFNLSRREAQELIKNKDCKVNQRIIDNTSFELHEHDVISLKGHGRGSIESVGGLSKGGKIFVNLAKLI